MDDQTSKAALKATSGVLSGVSGSLLLAFGLFAGLFGHCTSSCGAGLREQDQLGSGTFVGMFLQVCALGIYVLAAVAAVVGIGFVAAAFGFGFSIFKSKDPGPDL